ncbi:MAG: type II secretion system secretin GspD [Candidatus Lambdaproteobacteria bacterium]|nr:type II secretion system secretin GspD [Candidatus Lambdaproteobacteria bacterium]
MARMRTLLNRSLLGLATVTLAVGTLTRAPAGLRAQGTVQAPAQPPKPARKGEPAPAASGALIEMNFRNVEISNILSIMSKILGIAFVFDDKDIKGKITLVSPRAFSPPDAFRIFETVLAMQGFTMIRKEGSPVVQVVPSRDAPRYPTPTRTEGQEGDRNVFVTQIIPLKFADANQVRGALQTIISKTAVLAVYPPANVLLLTDAEENVTRVLSIIKELDIAPSDIEFAVIRLKYASARKLAPTITGLLSQAGRVRPPRGQPQPGAQVEARVVADDRLNALILVADPPTMTNIKQLIESLDVSAATEDRGLKVYRLEHADAEDMAKILTEVKKAAETRPPTAPGAPPAPPRPEGPAPVSQVTADKPTNSLIAIGNAEFIDMMDEMIAKLDIRRPQVFVEALIMEASLDKSLQLGVTWQSVGPAGGGVVGGGFPTAAPQTLANVITGASAGSVLGIVGNEIEFQGQKFTSFSAFIQATRQDQDLNILANPQLLTLNNEAAEINVSQVIPVSSKIVTNVNNQTTTEFEFKDVGIILKLTPQITGQDKVRLIIDQESSSVAARQAPTSGTSQQAITTLKRRIKSKVLVDDNTTVAIGGLIQNQEVETETKVPCLGDIPVLGWFFKSRAEELRRTNLIVFIRPRIIHTVDTIEDVTQRARARYEEARRQPKGTEAMIIEGFELDQSTEGGPGKPAPEPKGAPGAGALPGASPAAPAATPKPAAPAAPPKSAAPAQPAPSQPGPAAP